MSINSRAKGARGEREFANYLKEKGYSARRGQQFAGGSNSPDVVCDSLPFFHIEVKSTEKFNLFKALEQARRDNPSKLSLVAHRKKGKEWSITMYGDEFFNFFKDYLNGPKNQAESL